MKAKTVPKKRFGDTLLKPYRDWRARGLRKKRLFQYMELTGKLRNMQSISAKFFDEQGRIKHWQTLQPRDVSALARALSGTFNSTCRSNALEQRRGLTARTRGLGKDIKEGTAFSMKMRNKRNEIAREHDAPEAATFAKPLQGIGSQRYIEFLLEDVMPGVIEKATQAKKMLESQGLEHMARINP